MLPRKFAALLFPVLLAAGCGGSTSGSGGGGSSATVPGAPTITAGAAGDSSATLTFSAPTSNGGAAITGYVATCSGAGASRSASGSASPLTVTGLTNGTTYSCSVTASNSVGTGAASTAVSVTPAASTKPNILFVIADDFGLDASPCHPSVGALKPNMPNLARLCANGVVFDQYWSHPTCTPTRSAMLSGKYGIHTGVMAVDEVLATGTTTILQRVQEGASPYATAVIGKWHVSGNNPDPNIPSQFGAQYYAGFLTGAVQDYYNWRITVNGTSSAETGYVTSVLTDKAIAWVGAQNQPWFLWLAYNAPHTPFHTPPDSLYTQAGLKNGTATDNRTKYFAAAEALDAELGRLLAAIPPATLANTVIVFMGDNGTPAQVIQSPYSAGKAKDTLYQGGINVPLIVSGAGVSRSGQRDANLIGDTDIFATLLELAGRSGGVPADSFSFAPLLRASGTGTRTHAYIDVRSNGVVTTAIRNSRYKLIEFSDGSRALYDLATDPYESTNLLSGGTTTELTAIVNELLAKRSQFQS